MPARIPASTTPRRRDYAFLIERLLPRGHLQPERDAALTQALALGQEERLFTETVLALRELADHGLYEEITVPGSQRVSFRSTRTRDRVHLVQPTSKQQASRPTPGTVAETPAQTQPRIVGDREPSGAASRKPTAHAEAAPPSPPRPMPREGRAPRADSPRPGAPTGADEPAPARAGDGTQALAAWTRLEPVLELVAIEPRLAHLAQRLRRMLAQVEKALPETRVRLWHLEGATDEELGNGVLRTLSRARLESTPHFREALRTSAPRYATQAPTDAEGAPRSMAAAVPLRLDEAPWGLLEIIWSHGSVQSVAAFAPLLQPLARLVELAIRNQATLEKLVFVDPLTGVYNRAFYERQLTLEMERAQRTNRKFALLVMDVDDFKSINDRFGHRAGDTVLSSIASEVLARMRKIDLLFRYGGEEFVLLLPGAEQEEARRTAERLRAVVSDKRFEVEEASEPLHVTVSLGVAIYPDDSRTQSGLFKHADAAMFRAKEQGKNRVAYE